MISGVIFAVRAETSKLGPPSRLALATLSNNLFCCIGEFYLPRDAFSRRCRISDFGPYRSRVTIKSIHHKDIHHTKNVFQGVKQLGRSLSEVNFAVHAGTQKIGPPPRLAPATLSNNLFCCISEFYLPRDAFFRRCLMSDFCPYTSRVTSKNYLL